MCVCVCVHVCVCVQGTKHKTAPMVHRRLMKKLKNSTHAATIDVCVAEVMEDLVSACLGRCG